MRSSGRLFFPWLLFLLPIYSPAQTGSMEGSAFDVDIYGNVYVLDGERNTLSLYDRSWKRLKEIGGPGWLDGQFDRPSAVWARNGIDVFVADFGNHRIERFDRSLNFVSSFSTHDSDNPDDRFGYPAGVALSRLGELFICDTENSRIVKVDRFSTVERTFGGFGGGKGRLISPRGVALGPGDAVCVLDGARVALFDAFGNYLRDLPLEPGRRPLAIAADEAGVAVLDSEALLLFDGRERPLLPVPLATIVSSGAVVRALALAGGMLYLLAGQELVRIPDPRASSDIENKPISH